MKKREVNDDGGECRDVGGKEEKNIIIIIIIIIKKGESRMKNQEVGDGGGSGRGVINYLFIILKNQPPGVSAMPWPKLIDEMLMMMVMVVIMMMKLMKKLFLCWRGIKKERPGKPSTTSILWQEKNKSIGPIDKTSSEKSVII
jgi:hypothetical protein